MKSNEALPVPPDEQEEQQERPETPLLPSEAFQNPSEIFQSPSKMFPSTSESFRSSPTTFTEEEKKSALRAIEELKEGQKEKERENLAHDLNESTSKKESEDELSARRAEIDKQIIKHKEALELNPKDRGTEKRLEELRKKQGEIIDAIASRGRTKSVDSQKEDTPKTVLRAHRVVPKKKEAPPVSNPETPTEAKAKEPQEPTKPEAPKERHERPAYLGRLEKGFGISEDDLENVPGYNELTGGQKALVQERFKEIVLRKIKEDARQKQSKDQQATGVFQRIFGQVTKSYHLAKLEQTNAREIKTGGIALHQGVIEQLVAGTRSVNESVNVDGRGKIEVLYTPGIEARDKKEQKQIDEFNKAARAFAKVPHEWSLDSASFLDRRKHTKTHDRFEKAREALLEIKQQHGGSEQETALWENDIDARIEMDRFFARNPKAEKEIEHITDTKVWRTALNNMITAGGIRVVSGTVFRAAAGLVFGAYGAPLIAPIIGGLHARVEARSALRGGERRARAGEKDTSGTALNMVDAAASREKLEYLTGRVEAETDPEKRAQLLGQLKERTSYTKEKLESAKMRFGEGTEKLKNQIDIIQALGTAFAFAEAEDFNDTSKEYRSKLSTRLARHLDPKEQEISESQRQFLNSATKRGAIISAGFGAAGYAFREFAPDLFGWTTEQASPASSDGAPPASGSEIAPYTPREPNVIPGVIPEHPTTLIELEIGSRGPEGAIIDRFVDNEELAHSFGWDGETPIKEWAGSKAHALWLDHAKEALHDPSVQYQLESLGYSKDMDGYAQMMTRLTEGTVALDSEHGTVDITQSTPLSAPEPTEAPVSIETASISEIEPVVPETPDISESTTYETDVWTAEEGGASSEEIAHPKGKPSVEQFTEQLFDGDPQLSRWKEMGARRFLNLEIPEGLRAHELQEHVRYLVEATKLEPKGGFWRPNENVKEFILRARTELLRRKG